MEERDGDNKRTLVVVCICTETGHTVVWSLLILIFVSVLAGYIMHVTYLSCRYSYVVFLFLL